MSNMATVRTVVAAPRKGTLPEQYRERIAIVRTQLQIASEALVIFNSPYPAASHLRDYNELEDECGELWLLYRQLQREYDALPK